MNVSHKLMNLITSISHSLKIEQHLAGGIRRNIAPKLHWLFTVL